MVMVSEVSMEGHDVAVSQAAVQGDLSLHLQAQPYVYTPCMQ